MKIYWQYIDYSSFRIFKHTEKKYILYNSNIWLLSFVLGLSNIICYKKTLKRRIDEIYLYRSTRTCTKKEKTISLKMQRGACFVKVISCRDFECFSKQSWLSLLPPNYWTLLKTVEMQIIRKFVCGNFSGSTIFQHQLLTVIVWEKHNLKMKRHDINLPVTLSRKKEKTPNNPSIRFHIDR